MILVTGASGVVGTPLLERLPGDRVIALSHRAEVGGARVVHGDVTKPRLGLSEADYASLADEVELVIHSAAMTRFDAAADDVFAVNVGGVRNVCDFVRDAGARLVHLSTAFVRVDAPEGHGWLSVKPYIDSKRAGEEVVRESGLRDVTIVRPSIIIGDSETGGTARLQGYHFLIRSLLREDLPITPNEEHDRIDFVSGDLVADVVARIALDPPPFDEAWVTAGDDAWFVPQILEQAAVVAREHGKELELPRFVPPDMVDRLVRPAFGDVVPKRLLRRYDQVTAMSSAVVIHEPFPSTLDELRAHYGETWELDLTRTFRSSTAYLMSTLKEDVHAAAG